MNYHRVVWFLWVFLLLPFFLQASDRGNSPLDNVNWTSYEDEAVRLLKDYLRIDTSNPPGGEMATAEFWHRTFDAAGIPNTIYPYAPDRANFRAVLKGDGSERPLVMLNHMDVVRAEPRNWREPPFSANELNGEIYARGALDMKDEGLLQAMVMLVAARQHLPLKRDLIFLATADEEVGDTGSGWVLDGHRDLLANAEYLITEGGSNLVSPGEPPLYGVGVGEKAPFWLRVTATGRGGHGSIPISDSAANRLVRALVRIVNWQPPIRLLPEVEQYFHEIASTQPEARAAQFRNIRESLRSPDFVKWVTSDPDLNYMLRDTVSLTVLKGSEQTNVIPDIAYGELDVRLLPGTEPHAFLEELKKVVADDQIQLEPLSPFRQPNSSSTDTPLYRAIQQVVHEYDPQGIVLPKLNSGYTESQMYRPLGIVCYGFSPVLLTPELDDTEHAANERVPVEQIRHGVRMLSEVVLRVAGE
jgi:acetylornithine deacetylase/succinyl-diaminopimelate desuccinylase-like protein